MTPAADPSPPAGLAASAGSGMPVPLAYVSGGVQWRHDGDTLQVFVPADRNARAAVGLSLGFGFVGGGAVQMWNCWGPLARAAVAHAPWSVVLNACEKGVWGTVLTGACWGVLVWVVARRTRPVLIIAGPDGIRYGSPGTERPKMLSRGDVAAVRCGRLLSDRFATLNASGRFSSRVPWRVSRRLAAGNCADLEAAAAELRATLGLPEPPI